jgi:hypothetical protein
MSIARIIAQLVARGEEDLAEELLSISAAEQESEPDQTLHKKIMKSASVLVDAWFDLYDWSMESGHREGGKSKYHLGNMSSFLDKAWGEYIKFAKLHGFQDARKLLASARSEKLTVGNFSSKIKSNLTRAAKRTGEGGP